MNITIRTVTAGLMLSALCACGGGGHTASDVGLLDANRVQRNWPKFLNYENQFNADAQALQQSKRSNGDKLRARDLLQRRFAQAQNEIADDVENAAKQVAAEKNLKYVMTKQYVGFGGVDITADVEKKLNITESSASPAP
jgi:hypothetical protein